MTQIAREPKNDRVTRTCIRNLGDRLVIRPAHVTSPAAMRPYAEVDRHRHTHPQVVFLQVAMPIEVHPRPRDHPIEPPGETAHRPTSTNPPPALEQRRIVHEQMHCARDWTVPQRQVAPDRAVLTLLELRSL